MSKVSRRKFLSHIGLTLLIVGSGLSLLEGCGSAAVSNALPDYLNKIVDRKIRTGNQKVLKRLDIDSGDTEVGQIVIYSIEGVDGLGFRHLSQISMPEINVVLTLGRLTEDPGPGVWIFQTDPGFTPYNDIVLDLKRVAGRRIFASDLIGSLKGASLKDFKNAFGHVWLEWRDISTGEILLQESLYPEGYTDGVSDPGGFEISSGPPPTPAPTPTPTPTP